MRAFKEGNHHLVDHPIIPGDNFAKMGRVTRLVFQAFAPEARATMVAERSGRAIIIWLCVYSGIWLFGVPKPGIGNFLKVDREPRLGHPK